MSQSGMQDAPGSIRGSQAPQSRARSIRAVEDDDDDDNQGNSPMVTIVPMLVGFGIIFWFCNQLDDRVSKLHDIMHDELESLEHEIDEVQEEQDADESKIGSLEQSVASLKASSKSGSGSQKPSGSNAEGEDEVAEEEPEAPKGRSRTLFGRLNIEINKLKDLIAEKAGPEEINAAKDAADAASTAAASATATAETAKSAAAAAQNTADAAKSDAAGANAAAQAASNAASTAQAAGDRLNAYKPVATKIDVQVWNKGARVMHNENASYYTYILADSNNFTTTKNKYQMDLDHIAAFEVVKNEDDEGPSAYSGEKLHDRKDPKVEEAEAAGETNDENNAEK